MGLIALACDDQALNLLRQLVAHRPFGPVGQSFERIIFVALENLVSGLARDAGTPGRAGSSVGHRAGGQQSAGVRP